MTFIKKNRQYGFGKLVMEKMKKMSANCGLRTWQNGDRQFGLRQSRMNSRFSHPTLPIPSLPSPFCQFSNRRLVHINSIFKGFKVSS